MGNHMAMMILASCIKIDKTKALLPRSIISVFFAVRLEQHLMLILQRRVLPLPLGFEEQGERVTTKLVLALKIGTNNTRINHPM